MARRKSTGPHDRSRNALVLSGGGARGAYQVGVVCGLAELGLGEHGRMPFDIVVGSSAGAINGGFVAAGADDFTATAAAAESFWSDLHANDVFRTDLWSLSGIGVQWVRDLTFGGLLREVGSKSLLDTAPLRDLLADIIPVERFAEHVASGALHALAIVASDLYTSNGILFLQGRTDIPLWSRSCWQIERTDIGIEHLMASCAIPVFFPSVEIGGRHYGDGSIRNTSPLSPAINLGARRIVAVGVRDAVRPRQPAEEGAAPPTIAQIAGVLLDAVMLDAIEVDVEHSGRVNDSILACGDGTVHDPFRWVDVLWITPSASLAEIAAELAERIPPFIRYLLRGLGGASATTELASYLLFEPAYCSRLIELGRKDVLARGDEITAFFAGRPTSDRPAAASAR